MQHECIKTQDTKLRKTPNDFRVASREAFSYNQVARFFSIIISIDRSQRIIYSYLQKRFGALTIIAWSKSHPLAVYWSLVDKCVIAHK